MKEKLKTFAIAAVVVGITCWGISLVNIASSEISKASSDQEALQKADAELERLEKVLRDSR